MLGAYISNYVEQYWKTISKKTWQIAGTAIWINSVLLCPISRQSFFLKAASTIKRQVSLI